MPIGENFEISRRGIYQGQTPGAADIQFMRQQLSQSSQSTPNPSWWVYDTTKKNQIDQDRFLGAVPGDRFAVQEHIATVTNSKDYTGIRVVRIGGPENITFESRTEFLDWLGQKQRTVFDGTPSVAEQDAFV